MSSLSDRVSTSRIVVARAFERGVDQVADGRHIVRLADGMDPVRGFGDVGDDRAAIDPN